MNKLIKISFDHYILVDDGELKIGTFIYSKVPNLDTDQKIRQASSQELALKSFEPDLEIYRITHSTEPLEKKHSTNGVIPPIPVFDKIKPLSLIQSRKIEYGYDLNQLSSERLSTRFNENSGYHKFVFVEAYKEGFDRALEILGDKMFNRQDVIHALTYGVREAKKGRNHSQILEEYRDVHLQQQSEWDIDIEMECKKIQTFCDKCNSIVSLDNPCKNNDCNNWIQKIESDGFINLKKV